MSTDAHAQPVANIPILLLCAMVLIVAVLGGGGRGGLGDVLAQQLAIILLAFLGWKALRARLSWRAAAWVRWLPALALALPLLQLLPIPMALWTAGPARAELAAQLAQVGVAPLQMISLNPTATEEALWTLLPATGLFLATLTLPRKSQQVLLLIILILAVASVLFGMAQLAGGTQSPLRLYRPTNADQAVGFFANRNHLASLLSISLALTLGGTAWAVTERLAGRRLSVLWIFAGSGLAILFLLGIALARSRAGVLLAMVAVLGTLPIVIGLRHQRGTKRFLAITLGVAVMLSVQFGMFGLLQRVGSDPFEDGRWSYARTTSQAAAAYSPVGSGLGTFQQAYQPFEAKGSPSRAIVNHAHNDYLELWLEGGWPALLLIGLGALAWGRRGLQLWRRNPEPGTSESWSNLLTRAAWLAASLALIHSALDYPLRTTALSAVFAIVAAVAFSDPTYRARRAPTV
jgi:O-antigen ligase